MFVSPSFGNLKVGKTMGVRSREKTGTAKKIKRNIKANGGSGQANEY